MDLALFDFDGTLTSRETFGAFVGTSVAPARLALGRILLAPIVLSYRAGFESGVATRRRVVSFAYRGADATAYREAGRRFAREVVPTLVRSDVFARVEWHRARGDHVVVVSGAFDAYLVPWCAAQGLDVLCSALEEHDGRLTGRYAGAQCVGEEKVARIRSHLDLAAFDTVWAYGDTPEDEAMLALATRAYYRGLERRAA